MLTFTGSLEPHQLAAVNRLHDALVELDSYPEVDPDDSFITVDDGGNLTQLSDEVGAMFTLGHLRDIITIFYGE